MKKALAVTSLFTLPLIASAQNVSNLRSLISEAGNILNMLIPVLIAFALVVFFWGLVRWIISRKASGGKDIMIAGLVALFIMVSVWGIIRLAQNSLGLQGSSSQPIQPPYVPQAY